ncbi:unnamed protein product, partial [Meganyctiphanes norvegica]
MNTTSEIHTSTSSWEFYVVVVSLCFTICFMIIGNVFVIVSVFTYKPLRKVPNFYIVSLAMADLMLAILVLPFSLLYAVLGNRWVLGVVTCKIWLTLDILVCTASIHSLCAIAIDRYCAITEPIIYVKHRTVQTMRNKMMFVWGLSTLISLPPLFGWNNWPDNFMEDEICKPSTELGYVIYSALGTFYLPLFVMSVLYFSVYKALYKRGRLYQFDRSESGRHSIRLSGVSSAPKMKRESANSHKSRNSRKSMALSTIFGSNTIDIEKNSCHEAQVHKSSSTKNYRFSQGKTDPRTKSRTNSDSDDNGTGGIQLRRKMSLSREMRASKTLGIVMGVFVICWLPFFIMYLIVPFCDNCFNARVEQLIIWLGYINSAVNPVIYTSFNLDFRRAFAQLVKCKICK